jgi:DNA-binding transcriptional MocR family regulator
LFCKVAQYDVPPTGHPSLREWAREFTQKMHAPPLHVGHGTIITDGSTRGIDIVTSLFLDPGDAILVEEYTYSHFLETLAIPRGYNIVPVAMDDQGLEPTALRATLQRLKAEKKPIPRLLYVIPTGQNPTGSVASSQRITEVYTVCQDFDIFILEDDPYALLRFPSCYVTGGGSDQTPLPGLHGLCPMPSYLGRDTDGRVVRLDSFAKSIAPGLRLGWATAAPMIADRMAMAVQATSLGGAMLSQATLAHVLASWGEQGLHEHLSKLQEAYATRAAAAVAAARTELQGLAEWTVPTAGMFMVRC